MKRSIAIFSGKFNPGHISLIWAFNQAFNDLGFETIEILPKEYDCFFSDNQKKSMNIRFYGGHSDKFMGLTVDYLMLVHTSVEDKLIFKCLKRTNNNLKMLFCLHEVFGGFRELFQDYCNKNESAKSTIRLAGAAQWAKWDIKHCSKVLLFSRIAEATFKNRYPTYAEKAYVIPLPFVKEKVPNENSIEKKYFSYIGSTTPAHGFKEYIDTISRISSDKDILFLIATKDHLSDECMTKIQPLIDNRKLSLFCGRSMTSDEINTHYCSSKCIWLYYRRSTQSGVLPKAMMFGVPVISSKAGSFPEFVIDGYNGFLIEKLDAKSVSWAYHYIDNNFTVMHDNCLAIFEKYFNYQTILPSISVLIDDISFKTV